jgi:peptidoglycan hydrolase CwlO-like protein
MPTAEVSQLKDAIDELLKMFDTLKGVCEALYVRALQREKHIKALNDKIKKLNKTIDGFRTNNH